MAMVPADRARRATLRSSGRGIDPERGARRHRYRSAPAASAPRPDQPGAERDDVAGGKTHPDHGRRLHTMERGRVDMQRHRQRVAAQHHEGRSATG
jgi:hypothetical protein